jgi:hypothetical protein
MENKEDKAIKEFWNEWLKSDETERLKLIDSLPIMDLMVVRNPSMLNSYFEDLANTLKPKIKENETSGKRNFRKIIFWFVIAFIILKLIELGLIK